MIIKVGSTHNSLLRAIFMTALRQQMLATAEKVSGKKETETRGMGWTDF